MIDLGRERPERGAGEKGEGRDEGDDGCNVTFDATGERSEKEEGTLGGGQGA